jgi:hypothetical protein
LRGFVGDDVFIRPADVRLKGPKITDEFIASNLRGMTSVRFLHIESSQLTDAAIPHIRALPNIDSLGLDCPKLTDAAIPHICELRKIDALSLDCPNLTDAALRQIASMPKLRALTVNSPHLTPSGIRQLKPLQQLDYFQSIRNPNNLPLLEELANPHDGQFPTDGPVRDILVYASDCYNFPIEYDSRAIPDVSVAKNTSPGQPIGTALDAVLKGCSLGYYLQDARIKICPRAEANEHRQGLIALRSTFPNLERSRIDW